jgi:glyoxylase-like metal-dependent hydrolase (beta-lactamase superfamily II)
MKPKGCFALTILCLIAALPQAVFAQGGLARIADNVYAYVDVKDASPSNSFGANAGVIVGTKGAVVVDTLISAKEAKRQLADLRAVTDKPVKYVINTHPHPDHALGNCVFEDLGAAIVAHSETTREMRAAGEQLLRFARGFGLTETDLEGTRVAYPEISFRDGLRIDLGGQIVELLYIAPSHSGGSILVYLPDRKVLFAGDALFTDFHPYLAEGNLEGWLKTLDAVLALDVEAIVPGHGPVSTKKDVKEMKEYLLAFDKKAREHAAGAKDAQSMAAELKKVLPARTRGEFLIPANVQKYLTGK